MATKEKWIFASMETDVDAVVLMNGTDPNLDNSFFYATGIPNGLFEGCVAILQPNRTEVLSSKLEELSSRTSGVRTTVFQDADHRHRLLSRRLKGMRRIGVNSREMTHANYLKIRKAAGKTKVVDVSADLENARAVKQPDEISKIKTACRIGSSAGEVIPDIVSEGMKETEAAAELNHKMMKLGATGPAFVAVVAFGSKSAEPHYSPGPRKLRRGQLALFDYGASYKRYVSDITRTFTCGRASKRQEEMYDVVLRAQLAALDAVRAGVTGKEVDLAARRVIDKSKFKGLFIHSTGHGIGVMVHDPGSLSPANEVPLKENMVLTVEPGVYVKGFGGVRIEDDILVTKRGCQVLTPCTKEFRQI